MFPLRACLLLVTWASYYMAHTSPNPPPTFQDKDRYSSLNSPVSRIQKYAGLAVIIQKASVSIIMLIELAFASDMPSVRQQLPSVNASLANQSSFVSPLFLIGVMCTVCGVFVRLWSYRTMGAHLTFQLSLLKDHKLITNGPYAYVRHPAYTALSSTLAGVFICELASGSWWAESRIFESTLGKAIVFIAGCLAVMCVTICSRAVHEDTMLHKNFGKEWEEWAQRVPSRFIPGIL